MNLKDELIKFRNRLIKEKEEEKIENYDCGSTKNVSLNTKVDNFINWYYKNMVKGHYTDIGEYHIPQNMRNFIEKVAVWYELRYPDYEVNRLMHCSGQEMKKINDVMFNSNKYINDLLDEDSEVRVLDWDKFYNTKAFISSLPCDEYYLLKKPKYTDLVHIDRWESNAHIHLTSNGFVSDSEYVGLYTEYKTFDKDLKGMHIKEIIKLFNEKGVLLPKNNGIEKAIQDNENCNYQREEMLNCIMYRIIERGGNRIGPRRAFLFAKEFKRNIDIPMMYGIDYSDPGLRDFMNEYLKAGGSKDLVCYVNYFSRTSDKATPKTITLAEIFGFKHNYTEEEKALHQRLVNVLSDQINQDDLQREEVKQKRIQRKIQKSKNI